MAETYAKLRAMTDDEVIAIYDQHARNTSLGMDWYRQELDRRSRERSEVASDRLAGASLVLARRTFWLSIAAASVGAVSLIVAIVTLFVTMSVTACK